MSRAPHNTTTYLMEQHKPGADFAIPDDNFLQKEFEMECERLKEGSVSLEVRVILHCFAVSI